MQILHVYKDYPPVLGGIEQHLHLVARHQARRGHQVTVLVTSLDAKTSVRQEDGVEVVRAGRLAHLASTPVSPALFLEMRRRRPDLTHLHFPYPPGEVAQLLFGRSRATVVTYHSDVVRQRLLRLIYRPLMMRVLRRVDRILPTSEAYAASSRVLRGFRGKCRVIPLGIETRRFALPGDDTRVIEHRRRFPGPLVLFVGRLRYYKALHVLIEAMGGPALEALAANLLVIGRGPMEESWQRLAAASNAAARIHFLGDVEDDELPAFYAAADVFALPSNQRSEAFGLSQVEAMASGTPVVSTELDTGTSFVNLDGETGRVVPAGDAGAFAAALHELLENEDQRQRMGRRAQQRATDEFDVDLMLDRLDEVYAEVLGF